MLSYVRASSGNKIHMSMLRTHLILSKLWQNIHQSNLSRRLRLVRKRIHDVLQSHFIFLGWWREAHHWWRVGNEACHVHQSKGHGGMLARTREYHARKHMNKLFTRCQVPWKLVIDVVLSHRKAILMHILEPGLKFSVIGNVTIWLVVNGNDFLNESRNGFPQASSVIPKNKNTVPGNFIVTSLLL